jgi:hypothetical protein
MLFSLHEVLIGHTAALCYDVMKVHKYFCFLITEEYFVINSEELIGTTEYLTL